MKIKKPPRVLSEIILEEGENIPFKSLGTKKVRFGRYATSEDILELISGGIPKDANAYHMEIELSESLFQFAFGSGNTATITYYQLPEDYESQKSSEPAYIK